LKLTSNISNLYFDKQAPVLMMQEAVMGSKGRHNEKKPKQDKAKKAETKKAAK
jgi:hypothetical protein